MMIILHWLFIGRMRSTAGAPVAVVYEAQAALAIATIRVSSANPKLGGL